MARRLGLGIVAASLAVAWAAGAQAQVTAADKAAAIKVTGGKFVDKESGASCDAFIEPTNVKDLNGDGKPEIVVTGTGVFCYGGAEQGYWMLQKGPTGAWKIIDQNQGIPTYLPTRGVGGWQDVEIGGPGFCFPINRFNGKAYAFLRNKEYQRGACARR
ncbi:hypothetical protein [Phenylobacterium sp.]|uniref:hypothetical protein n=1 Tax=Phenylobacterium sp. TaxID=1871053 RepID=UPI00286C1264|nr:hypothetical protein [Phenylobacterium sp.]